MKELRKMTRNKLIQLVDANDVNPDGTLDYTPPVDRPYDWTAWQCLIPTSRLSLGPTAAHSIKSVKFFLAAQL